MGKKTFVACLVICSFLLPLFASASDWMIFTPRQKSGYTWFYDKADIEYMKSRSFIGIPLPIKDSNYQKIWLRASSDAGDRIYQIELDCKGRTAKLFDNNGKGIYNLSEIDYLYERPIPPDTVFDMLRKAVCR
jgi:hypothetical protein